jgi:hypothetical protein
MRDMRRRVAGGGSGAREGKWGLRAWMAARSAIVLWRFFSVIRGGGCGEFHLVRNTNNMGKKYLR